MVFSIYISPIWASPLGMVWTIGGIAYAWRYYQAPENKGISFCY
jgi:hypothetical protein